MSEINGRELSEKYQVHYIDPPKYDPKEPIILSRVSGPCDKCKRKDAENARLRALLEEAREIIEGNSDENWDCDQQRQIIVWKAKLRGEEGKG